METNWCRNHMKDLIRGSISFLLYIFAIICICILEANAQGNRGVAINLKKFDGSSGVKHMATHQFLTPSSPKVNIVLSA